MRLKALKTIARPLRRERPVIVMYHRVADLAVDPWGLAVGCGNFAAQIEQLRRCRVLLPLAELVARVADGTLPRRAAALSFDDGYRDNLTAAAPVLAREQAPATLFLATGPTERRGSYWWDELAAMILDAPPVQAEVAIGGEPVRITLGEREAADDDRTGWRAWSPRTARERLHYRLWEQLRGLPPGAVEDALAALGTLFGRDPSASARALSTDEVRELLDRAPIVLGGHTDDHPDLPALDPRAALDQIMRGRERIRAITGEEPVGFAYPYGRNAPATRRLVEAAGFRWACTTAAGHVGATSDRFGLPRIAAPDVPDIRWLN